MSNHPNRSRRKDAPGRTPEPSEIIAARNNAGLTQSEAAALVHSNLRAWQRWEAGDTRMHPAIFELFRLKT